MEIILVDLDRANMRAAAAEREVTVLQEQLAEARSRWVNKGLRAKFISTLHTSEKKKDC